MVKERRAIVDADLLRYQVGSIMHDHPYCEGARVPAPGSFIEEHTQSIIDRIFEVINPHDYRVVFTGKDNFRFDIAKEQPYKGNRSTFEKPYHWESVDTYIKQRYSRKVVTCNGYEADDYMALHRFYDNPDVEYYICTRDKDLNTVPGWHYSWSCGESQPEKMPYYVTPFEATSFFFQQCLTGDSTDNIPGCGRRVPVMRGGPIWVNKEEAGEDLIALLKEDKLINCKKDGTIVIKTPQWLVEDLVEGIEKGIFFTEKCREENRRKGVGEKEAISLLVDCETLGDKLEVVKEQYEKRFPEEGWGSILLENARLLFMGSTHRKIFDWSWLDDLLHVDDSEQYKNKSEFQIKKEYRASGLDRNYVTKESQNEEG
jgi:5'-3' exonuclease